MGNTIGQMCICVIVHLCSCAELVMERMPRDNVHLCCCCFTFLAFLSSLKLLVKWCLFSCAVTYCSHLELLYIVQEKCTFYCRQRMPRQCASSPPSAPHSRLSRHPAVSPKIFLTLSHQKVCPKNFLAPSHQKIYKIF